MFPKHSLITINQQVGGAAACPCEHFVNGGTRLSSGQNGDCWCLIMRNEQALSLQKTVFRVYPHALLTFFYTR